MDRDVELDEMFKDFMRELGNIGTGNAVNALSQLLNCPLEIDTPNLRILPFQQLTEILNQMRNDGTEKKKFLPRRKVRWQELWWKFSKKWRECFSFC